MQNQVACENNTSYNKIFNYLTLGLMNKKQVKGKLKNTFKEPFTKISTMWYFNKHFKPTNRFNLIQHQNSDFDYYHQK